MNYNETLVDNKVTITELNELFTSMYDSTHWIPTYPDEFREHWGTTISIAVFVFVALMLFIGGIQKVCTLTSLFFSVGTMIVVFILGKLIGGYIMSSKGQTYLIERERIFTQLCDDWNEKHKSTGVHAETGKYGAYIIIQFNTPLKTMGKFLMQVQKVKKIVKNTYKKREFEEKLRKADESKY